jgi:hypothetical protein
LAELVDAHVGVYVDVENLTFYEHGVELEVVEGQGVAGLLGGVGQELAHEVGGVDLHLLGELVTEEGDEQEVELAGVAESLDAGVAEADGFFLGLGDEGDVGVGVEGDADAGAVNGGAEPGAGVDVDDDAVLLEGDVRVVGVDEAGGVDVAAHVVTAFRRVEELGAEGALEGLGRDFDFDGGGGSGGGKERGEYCEAHPEMRELEA